jgi:hypothetical protein
MARPLCPGRPPRGKLKSHSEWKRAQPAGRDKSRAAYEEYKARWQAARQKRLEELEEDAAAKAIAAVEVAKAAEQPLLGRRDWAKQQPPGAPTGTEAYDEYVASWRAAQAAREKAVRAGAGAGDDDEDGEEEAMSEEAVAAAADAKAKVRPEEARRTWGSIFPSAYQRKEGGARAPTGSGTTRAGPAASESGATAPSGVAEAAAAQALVGLGGAVHWGRLAPVDRQQSADYKERVAEGAKKIKQAVKEGRALSVKSVAASYKVSRTTLLRRAASPDPGVCASTMIVSLTLGGDPKPPRD